MSFDSEEEVVGVHHSGVQLIEGANQSLSRNYCTNCRKKIHCYVTVDDGKAEFHNTCKNDDCECKCRTHYVCKLCGFLHPHGAKCNRKEDMKKVYDPKTDELIQKLNKQFKGDTNEPEA